mgnify:CR=1 FL=1
MQSSHSERQKTADFFNRLGTDYISGTKENYAHIYERTNSLVLPHLRGRVLDLGSGGVDHFDDSVADCWVFCDISKSLLAMHRHSRGRMPVLGEAAWLPFESDSFDVVLLSFTLHHFARNRVCTTLQYLRKAFRNMARVCRPGGRLVVVENTLQRPFERLQHVLYPLTVQMLARMRLPPVLLLSEKRIVHMITEAGFQIRESTRFTATTKVLILPGTLPRNINPVSICVLAADRK